MPESVSAIASRISPTRIDGNQIEALMRAVLAEMEPLDRASRKRRGEAYRSQFYNRQHTVWNTVLNTCRFYYSDQGTPVRGPRTEQLFEEAFQAVVRALQTGELIKQHECLIINLDEDYMGEV